MRNRNINFNGFFGFFNLFRAIFIIQRAKIMQTIRQLNDYDANVVCHRHHHLAIIFHLVIHFGLGLQLFELGYPINEIRNFRSEFLNHILFGNWGIF